MTENMVKPPQTEVAPQTVESDQADTRTLAELTADLGKNFSTLTYTEMMKQLPNGSDNEEVANLLRTAREKNRNASGVAQADAEKSLGVQLPSGEIVSQEAYDNLPPEEKAARIQSENINTPDEL